MAKPSRGTSKDRRLKSNRGGGGGRRRSGRASGGLRPVRQRRRVTPAM